MQEITYHDSQEMVYVVGSEPESGIDDAIAVVWVDTASMPADGLIKRLSAAKHDKLVQQLKCRM